MKDAAFIVGLMRQNSDALGFIPSTAIASRWIPKTQYIIVRSERRQKIGYLLHGRMRSHHPCHVNQVCLELDKRRRRHATAAVLELLGRARQAGATKVLLRCAQDLEANRFWLSMGFLPYSLEMGGFRRRRIIIGYQRPLELIPVPQDRS